MTLILAAVASGCDSGTDTGETIDGIDAPAIESAVADLVRPLQYSLEGTRNLRDALPALGDSGVVFDLRTPADRVPGRHGIALLDIIQPVELPPELLGSTFVYNLSGGWAVDPERTGAPTDGVRVIWYGMDPSGTIFPDVENGYIDLFDESDQTTERLGLRMINTAGDNPAALAEMTQSFASTGDVQWEDHLEAGGYYTDGQNRVDFDLSSDASGDTDTGDGGYTLDITLVGESTTYDMSVVGMEDGDAPNEETFNAAVTFDGQTTELDLDIVFEAGEAGQGNGTLTHAGAVVANVSVASGEFTFTTLDGGSLGSGQAAELENMAWDIYVDGYIVLQNLPLIFE